MVRSRCWMVRILVFAHELGHNFGSWHNTELYDSKQRDTHVPYAHGLRIAEDPSVPSRWPGFPEYDGYHTIMAYQAYHSWNSINYWSNPDISFTYQGVTYATGEEDHANAARVLRDNSVTMAACGNDKNSFCPTTTAPTTTTARSSTTTTITTTTTTETTTTTTTTTTETT